MVFFSQAVMSFRSLYGWLRTDMFIWAKVVQPVSAMLLFTLVAKYALRQTDLSYYVIGNALVACWTTAFAGITAMLASERARGTLPYLIITPTSRFVLFAGRAFFYLVDGLATVTLVLMAGSVLFGLSYATADLPAMGIAVVTGVLSVSCAGMLLGAWALIYRDLNTIVNVATSLLLMFTGINFPVSSLPAGLSALTLVLPLTRSVAATRAAYLGASVGMIAPLLFGELAVGIAYLVAGYCLFRWTERQARLAGSFDLY